MSKRKDKDYIIQQAKREEEEQIARILQREYTRIKNEEKYNNKVKYAKLEVILQYLEFTLHKERDMQIVNNYIQKNKFEEDKSIER